LKYLHCHVNANSGKVDGTWQNSLLVQWLYEKSKKTMTCIYIPVPFEGSFAVMQNSFV